MGKMAEKWEKWRKNGGDVGKMGGKWGKWHTKPHTIAKETSCHPTARLLLKMGNKTPKVLAFGIGTRWLKEVSMWEKERLQFGLLGPL